MAALGATRKGVRRDLLLVDLARATGAPPITARAGSAADMTMGGYAGSKRSVARACARGSDGETGDANAISTTDQSSKPREAERWTPPVRARGASDWRPCKTRSRNSTVSPLSPVSPVASTRKREADFFLPFPPPTSMYHIDRRLRFPGTGYSRFISPWPRASNVIRVSCRTSVALVLTQGSLSHRIV